MMGGGVDMVFHSHCNLTCICYSKEKTLTLQFKVFVFPSTSCHSGTPVVFPVYIVMTEVRVLLLIFLFLAVWLHVKVCSCFRNSIVFIVLISSCVCARAHILDTCAATVVVSTFSHVEL